MVKTRAELVVAVLDLLRRTTEDKFSLLAQPSEIARVLRNSKKEVGLACDALNAGGYIDGQRIVESMEPIYWITNSGLEYLARSSQ